MVILPRFALATHPSMVCVAWCTKEPKSAEVGGGVQSAEGENTGLACSPHHSNIRIASTISSSLRFQNALWHSSNSTPGQHPSVPSRIVMVRHTVLNVLGKRPSQRAASMRCHHLRCEQELPAFPLLLVHLPGHSNGCWVDVSPRPHQTAHLLEALA